MAVYKGYEIDDGLYSIIRHMPQIDQYRKDLERQQVLWDYLSVMAQLENLENDLNNASQKFNYLTGVLLNRLGLEGISKAVNEYGFKSQVAINILVRNLFERTADIGFLATDGDVRRFLVDNKGRRGMDISSVSVDALRARFEEYVKKYSVYNDVVLLSPQGYVLARLNDRQKIEQSHDPFIKEALATNSAYVEKFGYSDLFPDCQQSLIYAYRVESSDQSNLGVICLSFKFQDEITEIFNGLVHESFETLLIVDNDYRVIATNREDLTPVGTRIKLDINKPFDVVNCKGSEYLACVRKAESYQGYTGPSWYSYALLDLDEIFREDLDCDESQFSDKETLDSVMRGNLFDPATKAIPVLASQIESELNRSVWNGNARQASERNGSDALVSRVLLDEIKNTGEKNKTIFERAIFDIQKTVISEILRLSQSSAALAIEIMDRNLYERANDCRWWALDSILREALSQPKLSAGDTKNITSVLEHINALYTVYTNLIVFDRQGMIVAVSDKSSKHIIGSTLDSNWVKSLLLHQSTSQYAVSEFEKTSLYGEESTYIYGAAIRNPEGKKVVGGIGIVFDAKPQFTRILEDVLANEKFNTEGDCSFALFADGQQRIIASTHPDFVVGDTFTLGVSIKPNDGENRKGHLVKYNEHFYAAAGARSLGYREYKGKSDDYQSEVFAYAFFDIGAVNHLSDSSYSRKPTSESMISSGGYKMQISSFYIGEHWFGIQSERIECALNVDKVIPIHGSNLPEVIGYIPYKNTSVLLVNSGVLFGSEPTTARVTEVVIVKLKDKLVAMGVDHLGETLDVAESMIQPMTEDIANSRKLVKSIVSPHSEDDDKKMLQLVDLELMAKELSCMFEMAA